MTLTSTVTVRKAVIPAAGLGTRFLPVTKTLPKEMLPIIDIPTIQLIVEEAVASGIRDILVITNAHKAELENYFDVHYELETRLKESGKHDLVAQVRASAELANIHFVRQKEPKGLGHAVLCAQAFVGNEPFAVLLGDDVVYTQSPVLPALQQLMDCYHHTGYSVLGVQTVAHSEVNKYGIIDPIYPQTYERTYRVKSLVEKPAITRAPSRLAVLGRYILTPAIFDKLMHQAPGKGGEIQLTDAIMALSNDEPVFAYDFQGQRYDVGDRFGYVKAIIDYALRREDIKDSVQSYLDSIHQK